MQASLARAGTAVFALLLAVTILTERAGPDRALVASTSAIDLPALRELPPHPTDPAEAVPIAAPAASAVTAEDAAVVASWYGPGFYGNRTACGNTFTPEILGVAHLTLPCGTTLILTHGDRAVTVAVIDRGPYVAGRTLDLSSATKLVLGCPDLCTLRMRIAD